MLHERRRAAARGMARRASGWRQAAAAGLLALATTAAWPAHKVQDTPVAWVNGQPIPRTTLVELLNLRNGAADGTGRPLAPVTLADRQQALEEVVQLELVAQQAAAQGVSTTPEALAELAHQRDQVLGQRLLRLMAQETLVDEATLKARHAALPTEHEVSVRQVLLADEAAARDVIARLDAGADFAELARTRSVDVDSRQSGGLLPTANASNFLPAFAAAAVGQPLGRHGADPVHTEAGWHVLRVEARRAIPPPPLDQAREWLVPQMVNERVDAQVAAWREAATVEVLQPIDDGPLVTPEGDVATVDGRPISRLQLELVVKARNGMDDPTAPVDPNRPPPSITGRAATLDELVATDLLAHQARLRGLDKNPSVIAETDLQTKAVVGRLYVRHLIAHTAVRRTELEALYRTDVPVHDFKVSQILVADEAAARDVIARLDRGARFATVARSVSLDTASKAAGGSVGWVAHQDLPPAMADLVRGMTPGRHAAAPVRTANGWAVLRLDARRTARQRPSLDEAAVWLYPKLVHDKVQARMAQRRAQAAVRIVQ